MKQSEGSIAFGVNNIEAYFSQIKQSVMSPPIKPKESKKKVEVPTSPAQESGGGESGSSGGDES